MREFKFFSRNIEEPQNRSLLDNEQLIHFWNDGEEMELLTARVIAWRTRVHMDNPQWRLMSFVGTMEQFFGSILSIPVIRSIENGPLRYYRSLNSDEFPITLGNFQGNIQYIINYYEYI